MENITWVIIIFGVILGIILAEETLFKGLTIRSYFQLSTNIKGYEYLALILSILIIYGFSYIFALLSVSKLISVSLSFFLGGLLFGYSAKKSKGFLVETLIIIVMNCNVKTLTESLIHGSSFKRFFLLSTLVINILVLELGIYLGNKIKIRKFNNNK